MQNTQKSRERERRREEREYCTGEVVYPYYYWDFKKWFAGLGSLR